MSKMADNLRDLYDYASNHRVVSLSLLLQAADHIERLERQIAETRAYQDAEDARINARLAARAKS